jgi:hypothetical protein
LCEVEHVLHRPPESIQGRDDECVASLESAERSIELRPRCTSTRDALIDVQIIAPNAGSEKV